MYLRMQYYFKKPNSVKMIGENVKDCEIGKQNVIVVTPEMPISKTPNN